MEKECVQIVMSTYNGEKYIREQIESIINQKGVRVKLLIRDDGSTDNTLSIIKQYAKYNENISYYQGVNIGVCRSFFDLLSKVDRKEKYYAFADQDDIWKENKLERALSLLHKHTNEPALYVGAYELVDENKNSLNICSSKRNVISFGNSLIQCIYSGCTGVFNYKLLELVITQLPQNAYMHDWWLYMVAASMGKILCDDEVTVLYRQHANNVLGDARGKFKNIKKRIYNFKNLRRYVPAQAREFEYIFNKKLTDQQKKMIECIASEEKNPLVRMKIFASKEIRRNTLGDDILYKILFLIWYI